MEYNLDRFVKAQKRDYNVALNEIRDGYKRSHWMWYIFPQIAGLGSSYMAKKYELNGLGEAKAYMENEYLRNNLIGITKVLLQCKNNDIEDIMGFPDNLKLCSCMTLFEIASPKVKEFGQVLDRFFNGKQDQRTISILEENR